MVVLTVKMVYYLHIKPAAFVPCCFFELYRQETNVVNLTRARNLRLLYNLVPRAFPLNGKALGTRLATLMQCVWLQLERSQ